MRKRAAVVFSLACLLACAALPARAAFPIRRPAPEFPEKDAWLNAKPLTLKRLRGRRATLIAFINSANINSVRALKVLQAWHERYALQGLMVIGVHTPTFAFQRNAALVDADMRQRGAEFPIVLDDDRKIWEGYQNGGWPSFYLLDRKGLVVYDNVGEARYKELEKEIQAALADLGYKVRETDKLAAVDPPAEDCGAATTEFAVKTSKGVEDYDKSTGPTTVISAANEGAIYKFGPWKVDGETLRLTKVGDYGELDFSVKVVYRGAQGLALVSSGPAPKTRFFVRQDDLWLQPRNAGSDVKFDADGRSYVDVTNPRLYWVTVNANDNAHLISFAPAAPDAAFYGFSATDRCLPYAP